MEHDQRPLGLPMLDFMMEAQRSYLDLLRAFTAPLTAPLGQTGLARASGVGRQLVRVAENGQDQQVIGIGEESLDVSTRRVVSGTTRIRRIVRQVPVEQRVELRDETIIVERRRPNGEPAGEDALEQRDYVVSDIREIPVVNKQTRLREEVIIRRQTHPRVEIIRDVVRQADVQVEQPRNVVVSQLNEGRQHQNQPAGGHGDHQEHDKNERSKKG